jgi:arginyl-tRNA synthetase
MEITLAQARAGVVGDVLWRTWCHRGVRCEREYYVNDLRRRAADGDSEPWVDPESVLSRLGVGFDRHVRESELVRSGNVEALLKRLQAAGAVESRGAAKWLLTTRYGDVQDRVLLREDGSPTYLTVDLAYHLDKFSRGGRLVDLWDSAHGTYVARTLAGLAAAGADPERLTIHIVAPVRVVDAAIERRDAPGGGPWRLRDIAGPGKLRSLRRRLLSFPLSEEAWVGLDELDDKRLTEQLRTVRALPEARAESDPALLPLRNKASGLDAVIDQVLAQGAPHRLTEYFGELVDALVGAGRTTRPAMESLSLATRLLGLEDDGNG